MRSVHIYSLLALTFAAVVHAQIVLDPSPARVIGHPPATPAEQLVVTNVNPNLGASGGMYLPEGVAVDTTGSAPILYVADTLNNRILAWKNATSATLTNLQPPSLIIGQPNANTTLPATNGGLYYPTGLVVDAAGNLYVADSGNNRVLRYPTPFAGGSAGPDIVLGQIDQNTGSNKPNGGGAITAHTLCLSGGCQAGNATFLVSMAIDSSGNLYVTDAGNRRVLQFAAASLTSGATDPAASLVIGQAGFTVANRPSGVTDRNTIYEPAGLAFDTAGHLFVSDSNANRLLVFSPPFSNGMAASRLAGIVNPAPATATASTLEVPNGLVMINNGPAVLDSGNNRLLIFDAYSSADWTVTSGDTTVSTPPPVAIAVLGQGASLTNFTTSMANMGNAQPSSATLSDPVAAAVAGTDLFVVDAGNNRVLVFPNAGTAPAATVVLGQSDFPYDSPNSIQGKEFYFGAPITGIFDAGIVVDSSGSTPHLYISDPGNNRVLGFADARKAGPGVQADIVIGEPDMMTSVCNYNGVANPPTEPLQRQPTASSLCYPTGLAVDPATGNLFVADTYNGRVLRFPAPFANPTSLEAADLVLGQSGFTGISNTRASQSVMLSPYGLVFDPQRGLLVSDVSANRVLLFSMITPTSGEAASTVFGQTSFVGTGPGVLISPHHIAEDTIAELYVADTGHNQITIFDIPSGTTANTPVNFITGLSSPEAVWVNQTTVAGYQNDIWVGDNSGISRYPVPSPLGNNNTPTLQMPAAELTGGQSLYCSGTNNCRLPAIAITQDSFGALYVADSSNRVGIHYPALAGTNGASFVCAMGCNLGTLNDPPFYLAPGGFASLFTFAPVTFPVTATTNTAYPVPTTLGGVQVLVNGQASPITAVAPSQINFVVPFAAPASGTVPVAVVNPATSQILGSGSMNMNSAAPGFFTMNQAGTGQIAALNCNQSPCENTVNSASNPVQPGKYIQLYLTGQGFISGHPPDGQGSSGAVNTPSQPVVYVGGPPALVPQYSGLAPGFPGLWQINIQIPNSPTNLPGFPAGVFPVLIEYEGLASNTPGNNRNPAVATTIVINAPE